MLIINNNIDITFGNLAMIYDKIQNTIKNILMEYFNLSAEQILTENEIPNNYEKFFVRFVFNYGNLNEIGNLNYEEISTLVLEIYERKYIEETKIDKFVTDLRKHLIILPVISDENDNSRAKIIQITINRNDQETWKSFNLIFSIRLIWENE
jgi:hypothetical protein